MCRFCTGLTICTLWLCAAIIVLASFCQRADAAEIGCASLYGETRLPPQLHGDTRRPEQVAQGLWPLGARPSPVTCRIGFIQGEIVSGDYDKFLAFYSKNHPFLEQVSLNSRGGDVHEAIKIGRLFRKYLITAVSPYPIFVDGQFVSQIQMDHMTGRMEPCFEACRPLCASSCALIAFGAPNRAGRIGLHRPSTDDPNFKTLAPSEAAKAYRQMLDEIIHYLEEMEAPRPAIDTMVATGSAEIGGSISMINPSKDVPRVFQSG